MSIMPNDFSAYEVWDYPTFVQEVNKRYFHVETHAADPAGFRAQLASWNLGEVAVSRMVSGRMQHRRSSSHIHQDELECLLIPLTKSAAISFQQGDVDLRINAQQFLLQMSSCPYSYVQESSGEVWTVLLPLNAVRNHITNPARYAPYAFDFSSGMGRIFADMVESVPYRVKEMTAPAQAALSEILLQVLALTLENDSRVLGSQMKPMRQAMMTRAAKFIRQNLGNPELDPEMVALHLGISKRYLHQLFHENDTSVARWILEAQLQQSAHALRRAAPQESVAEIAFRCGFSDSAHFSRSFKRRFGTSPSAIKQLDPARCH